MKTKIAVPAILVLLITTILFAVLWQAEAKSKADYARVSEFGAKEAYESFVLYQSTGKESAYWDGVASFKQFQQAFYLYAEGSSYEGYYTVSNTLYGYMTLRPEAVRERIPLLIEAMELLSNDITHPNGYNKLSVLSNDIMVTDKKDN